MIKRLLLSGAVALALGGGAHAQANNSSTWATPGNQTVPGAVTMCPNAQNIAVPCANAAAGAAGLPAGATPIMVSGAATTAALVLTIPAVANKTAYLCGFTDDPVATGAAAAQGNISGLLGGTLNYIITVGTLTGTTPGHYGQLFPTCLPASAVNVAIALNSPGAGVGGVHTAFVWGFYL